MNQTAIIILAAGESSRMEQPKQLLPFKNGTLLGHVADEAQKSGMPVVIVLGANEDIVKQQLLDVSAEITYNEKWKDGISTSIKSGLQKAIENNSDIESFILCVCDQPYISTVLFQQLMEKKAASGKNIIACSYTGTIGTPVLFDKKYFDALMNLQGSEGAKKLLQTYSEDVALVSFEKGEIDIDTKIDYKELLKAI
jgi:molybdenum cofactor cytidylyltransferase